MSDTQSTALQVIAEHERSIRGGLVTRMFRAVGRHPAFAWAYRRIGPVIDRRLLRSSLGGFMSRLYGLPSLLLVTTGAKSGLPRTQPLLYVRDGDAFVVVGTNFGQAHHPAWTGNLLANPKASVEIGRAKIAVTGTLVGEAEFARLWKAFVAIYPGYTGYVERSGRSPRMFRLAPDT